MHRLGWIGLVVSLAIALTGCAQDPAGRASADVVESVPPSRVPPATAPGPTASPSFVRPTPNPSPTFLVHAVTRGETLTSIARLYGTTPRSIAFWNRDRYPSLDPDSTTYEPDRIEVGWTLRLIPTEVVDEDELPEPTAAPTPILAPSPASSATLESPGSSPASPR
jgi:hypothetical protein